MDTVELAGRQMKQCWIKSPGQKWLTNKNLPMGSAGTECNFQLSPLSRLYKKYTLSPPPPHTFLYSILFTSLWRKTFIKKGKDFSRGVSTSVSIPFRCFKKQRRPMHEGSIPHIGISNKSFQKYWRISTNRSIPERKESPEEYPQV